MLIDEEQVKRLPFIYVHSEVQSPFARNSNVIHYKALHQVRYIVGESFFHATPEEAEERLQTRKFWQFKCWSYL